MSISDTSHPPLVGGSRNPSCLRLAVFVGSHGRGSNMMAILAAITEGRLNAEIVCVIGARADAPTLTRAREAGLPTRVVSPRDRTDDEYAAVLLRVLASAGADTIVLAGYLRRLPSAVLAAFPRRIVNIHPSLLPSFGGQGMYGENVHRAVIASGVKFSGCTVHFADEEYDTGPILLQKVVPVEDADTPETLAARVLRAEHAAYAEALQLLAEDRLRFDGRRVLHDAKSD